MKNNYWWAGMSDSDMPKFLKAVKTYKPPMVQEGKVYRPLRYIAGHAVIEAGTGLKLGLFSPATEEEFLNQNS